MIEKARIHVIETKLSHFSWKKIVVLGFFIAEIVLILTVYSQFRHAVSYTRFLK